MSKKDKLAEKKEPSKVYFNNINPETWEHPADKVALRALKQVPGLDVVIKTFLGATTEKSLRLMTLASAVRTSKKQYPRVFKLTKEACKILDMEQVPEVYVTQTPVLNARAVGVENPFIILHSAMVEMLDDEELITVIGHELGHIKSGHMLYKTLLTVMVALSQLIINIPLGAIALQAIKVALLEWNRKSELSADRAGLLVCQNPEVAIRLEMKLAGGNNIEQLDLAEFVKQAEEYNKSDSFSDNMHKLFNLLFQTHPFHVIRVAEMLKWVQSGEYENILSGGYKQGQKSYTEDVKDAAEGYKQDIKETFDPLTKDVKDAAKKAKNALDDFFRPTKK